MATQGHAGFLPPTETDQQLRRAAKPRLIQWYIRRVTAANARHSATQFTAGGRPVGIRSPGIPQDEYYDTVTGETIGCSPLAASLHRWLDSAPMVRPLAKHASAPPPSGRSTD